MVVTYDMVARRWLRGEYGTDIFDSMPTKKVIQFIDLDYEGGWHQFCADFEYKPITPDRKLVDTTEQTQPQKKRALENDLGVRIRLGRLDEIVSWRVKPTGELLVTIRTLKVRELETRWRIESDHLIVHVFEKSDSGRWIEDLDLTVHIVDEDFKPYSMSNRPNSVWTAEKKEDSDWQYENCWRPGTAKSPMQGYAARLELCYDDLNWDD